MDIVLPLPNARSDSFAADIIRGFVQIWVNSCNAFREWERDELIRKDPSAETLEKHRKFSAQLIRTAQMLCAVMEDPEYPARQFLPDVRGKLAQLQYTRDMLHDNTMSEAEADALLRKVFPDEPAVGRAA